MLLPTITGKPPARNVIIAIPDDIGDTSEYVLLNRPTLLEDPFFKQYGNACVGSYAMRLKNRVPTGTVYLTVWRSTEEFYVDVTPIATLDVSRL